MSGRGKEPPAQEGGSTIRTVEQERIGIVVLFVRRTKETNNRLSSTREGQKVDLIMNREGREREKEGGKEFYMRTRKSKRKLT